MSSASVSRNLTWGLSLCLLLSACTGDSAPTTPTTQPGATVHGLGATQGISTTCPGGPVSANVVCVGKASYATTLPSTQGTLPAGWGVDVTNPCTTVPPAGSAPNQPGPIPVAKWWGSLVFQASAGTPGGVNGNTACTYPGNTTGNPPNPNPAIHAQTAFGGNIVTQPAIMLPQTYGIGIRQQRVDYNPYVNGQLPNPSQPNIWQNWGNPPNPLNQQLSGWLYDIQVRNVVGGSPTIFDQGASAVLQEYGMWHATWKHTTASGLGLLITAMRGSPYTWFRYQNCGQPGVTCAPLVAAIGNLFNPNPTQTPAPNLYTADDNFQTAKAQGTSGTSSTNVVAVGIADPANPTWSVHYAVIGPPGSTWTWETTFYTLTLNNGGASPYVVIAALPQNLPALLTAGTTRQAIVNEFVQYAFFYPANNGSTLGTTFTPAYAPGTQTNNVTGTFAFNLASLTGTQPTGTLVGLFPHQYAHLVNQNQLCSTGASSLCPVQQEQRYTTIRGYGIAKNSYDASFDSTQPYTGQMKLAFVAQGSNFQLQYTFNGVFPAVLPFVSGAWTPANMISYLTTDQTQNTAPLGPDIYNWAKNLSRVANNIEIAQQAQPGGTFTCDYLAYVKGSLENWFTADNGAQGIKPVVYAATMPAGLFTYNANWGSLIGFPAGDAAYGFGNQTFLNDHHFHYGYFIRAAAVVANALTSNYCAADAGDTFVKDYGPMVEHLIRDIAADYGDSLYPAYRHFDPYAGFSSAAGAGQFADGNNQESVSEAVNAWYGAILWAKYAAASPFATSPGSVTGKTIGQFANDLLPRAVYLYVSETDAANRYWYNADAVVAGQFAFQGNTFANLYDDKSEYNGFGSFSEYLHIIGWLPFGGGSLYLNANQAYPALSYAGMACDKKYTYTPTPGCTANPPTMSALSWQAYWDLIWMYRAFSNATEAQTNINTLLTQPGGFTPDSGNTLAMMYHWTQTVPNVTYVGGVPMLNGSPPPIK